MLDPLDRNCDFKQIWFFHCSLGKIKSAFYDLCNPCPIIDATFVSQISYTICNDYYGTVRVQGVSEKLFVSIHEKKTINNMFPLILLKFEIIWVRFCQVIRLQNDINFSETPFILIMLIVLYDRKRSLLIYHTHKIMIATCAHESIHRILSLLRLSSKWKKGFLWIGSAHSEMSMKFVKK